VSLETALNALWLCVGLSAFGVLGWSELHNPSGAANGSRVRRILCVVFAVVFLFPCVSESDDLLSLQGLQFTLETRGEVGNSSSEKPGDNAPGLYLAQFFEGLEAFHVVGLFALLITLVFVALVALPRASGLERCVSVLGGRAPPPFSL
jgi:hypothetical protein